MLRVVVGPDDLAASRFAIAPMYELTHLLRKLDHADARTPVGGMVRASRWAARYAPVRGCLHERVLRSLRRTSWGADFIAPPPTGMARTPADDILIIRTTPLRLAREQIRRSIEGNGPVDDDVAAVLTRRDVVTRLADMIEEMWQLLVAPDWPQLLAIAERDVLHRAERLAREGWAGALAGLHPKLRWQDGAVLVGARPDETVHLQGRGITFVPSVFLVRGARHAAKLYESTGVVDRLRQSDQLVLLPDAANPVNSKALLVATVDGTPIGWVPDLLTPYFQAFTDPHTHLSGTAEQRSGGGMEPASFACSQAHTGQKQDGDRRRSDP